MARRLTHKGKRRKININMRCIEIGGTIAGRYATAEININMRCIEIRLYY